MGDLVIRDKTTGQSKVFSTTRQGYAEAKEYMDYIKESGHEVGDDRSGSIKKVHDLFGNNW